MSSYLAEKRKEERNEAILKMDLEKFPEYYRKIFRDLLTNHQYYEWEKDDKFLDSVIFQECSIKDCNVYTNKDKFYNALQQHKKFFCKMYEFEITKKNQLIHNRDRVFFKENKFYSYFFGKRNDFDFEINGFYIILIRDKFKKEVNILIYNNLEPDDFLGYLSCIHCWKKAPEPKEVKK